MSLHSASAQTQVPLHPASGRTQVPFLHITWGQTRVLLHLASEQTQVPLHLPSIHKYLCFASLCRAFCPITPLWFHQPLLFRVVCSPHPRIMSFIHLTNMPRKTPGNPLEKRSKAGLDPTYRPRLRLLQVRVRSWRQVALVSEVGGYRV